MLVTSFVTRVPIHSYLLCNMARLYIVPVLFLWADAFNSLVLLRKQELAALIHRNTWTSNIVQESNKLLNTRGKHSKMGSLK